MDIVPALIPKSKDHLLSTLEKVKGVASAVQIDLVDGVYVPNAPQSWPWSTRTFLDEMYTVLADLSEDFELEIDMMVERPERFVEELVSAHVARIIIHVGSTDALEDILAFRSHVKIGLAFTNDTPLDALHRYREHIDFVQCMGIAEIGVQGNPFDARVLARITEIRAKYPELEIAVDGGVTLETEPRLIEAGATRLVVGSAIFNTSSPRDAERAFVEQAEADTEDWS